MGRDCGIPRPPQNQLTQTEHAALAKELMALSFMKNEPKGW